MEDLAYLVNNPPTSNFSVVKSLKIHKFKQYYNKNNI
jgi:hypothetical protein